MIIPEDLKSFILRTKLCVVHFSHHGKMRADGVFPDDLQAAIRNCADWTLSCCALTPGHTMALPGDVGVIFEIDNPKQIVSVCADDSGSSQTRDGKEQSLGSEPSLSALEESLDVVYGGYNEWRVRGAKVSGIYVENPNSIYAKRKVKFEISGVQHEDISAEPVQIQSLKNSFPNLNIFTFQNGCLIEIC